VRAVGETSSTRRSVMHIEKKSLVSKKIAVTRINAIQSINSRRIDLSKPAPVRVETCTHIKYMEIKMYGN
jgi:uncharacterized protein YpuA (DUF1002 family)